MACRSTHALGSAHHLCFEHEAEIADCGVNAVQVVGRHNQARNGLSRSEEFDARALFKEKNQQVVEEVALSVLKVGT